MLSSSAAALLGHSQQIQQNDVVAGEYEGGFKLWEGGVDLAAHVANLWQVDFTPSNSSEAAVMQGHHVLELGCGAGLPGAVALLAGAQQVVFQVGCIEGVHAWGGKSRKSPVVNPITGLQCTRAGTCNYGQCCCKLSHPQQRQ